VNISSCVVRRSVKRIERNGSRRGKMRDYVAKRKDSDGRRSVRMKRGDVTI
jgi:hypothetical protein